jgi:hypothetical protein
VILLLNRIIVIEACEFAAKSFRLRHDDVTSMGHGEETGTDFTQVVFISEGTESGYDFPTSGCGRTASHSQSESRSDSWSDSSADSRI